MEIPVNSEDVLHIEYSLHKRTGDGITEERSRTSTSDYVSNEFPFRLRQTHARLSASSTADGCLAQEKSASLYS